MLSAAYVVFDHVGGYYLIHCIILQRRVTWLWESMYATSRLKILNKFWFFFLILETFWIAASEMWWSYLNYTFWCACCFELLDFDWWMCRIWLCLRFYLINELALKMCVWFTMLSSNRYTYLHGNHEILLVQVFLSCQYWYGLYVRMFLNFLSNYVTCLMFGTFKLIWPICLAKINKLIWPIH